jgi:hypothetical protein
MNTNTHVRTPSPAVAAAIEAAREKNLVFAAREERRRALHADQRTRVAASVIRREFGEVA